ncbi:ABC transporter transmembrane domain-containing protein [Parasalinivibrio latis]|uniref:ABC transporter transmembrane domain-containing protein n=1 Tax=Parasalinivibrio latis TaxID=2952610 RepID=UPI0030E1B83C
MSSTTDAITQDGITGLLKDTRKTTILKRLLSFLWQDKRAFFTASAILLLAVGMDVAGPWIVRVFLDDYVSKGYYPPTVLWLLAVAYIGATTASALLHYYQGLRFSRLSINIVQRLRKQVFSSVLNQPLSGFDYVPSGKLVSRITNDTESLKELYVNVIATFIANLVLIVVMLVAMALLNITLTLIVAALLPAVIWVMWRYQRKSTPLFAQSRDLLADINGMMSESIQGMTLIQLMRQENGFSDRFAGLTGSHLATDMKIERLNGIWLRPLIDLLSGFALLTIVVIFGFSGTEVIGVGVLYAFLSYLGRLTEPLIASMQRMAQVQQAISAGERLFELVDTPGQRYGDSQAPLASGEIKVRDVHFSYDGKVDVLKGISCDVRPGGFLALAGHTGSGKSTLASLLMGFYPAGKGEILLGGQPLMSLSHNVLRQGIALVQQDPHVLSDSVRENITLGRDTDDAMVWKALETVGLTSYFRAQKNGLDTLLGEGGVTLSAGQKQLLALARVMVEQPKILILDEATANIDSGTEEKIQQALAAMRHAMTIVVIAHRLSTIIEADEIVVLHRGEVAERGSHQSLLSHKGRYFQMYEMQRLKRGRV